MGGTSAEREISLQTGAGVLKALEALEYPSFSVDFDSAFVGVMRARRPDVVFNALHGGTGEDGTVQAVLDWLGIPYQGSGVRASAIAMDKWAAKSLMQASGLPTPRGVTFPLLAGDTIPIPDPPGLPCVVKPRSEGSAVGVNIVHFAEQWAEAVGEAASTRGGIVVEEYVEGREFTVAVLADQALPVIEIQPHDDFYTYHAKYTAGASTHVVPADVSTALARTMQDSALRLHVALGCRDYSRTDMLLSAASNSIYLLECNTLPGLTPLSLFPEAAAAVGIGYEQLIDRLVQSAARRARVSAS